MGKSTPNAPSRKRVICGYPGCKYQAELRMMPRHTVAMHLSTQVKIKNASFGVGGQWHKWCATQGQGE